MPTIESNEIIDTSNISTKYGLAAGLLMSAFLLMMQLTGNDYRPFIKLLNYGLLAIPVVVALKIYRQKIEGDVFINGISLGAKLSFVASIVIASINIILFLISPELAFSKYGLEPSTLIQVIMISAIIFFETFVFGNLISFMALQFLKGRYKNEKIG